ncbi:MAG: hypothetical protein WCV70_02685 [Patescibacteria group bacterium]|jgi:hypothetical protein
MTISVDVAKAEGWRNKVFPPWQDCRDLPTPPVDTKNKPVLASDATLAEILVTTAGYAKKLRKKVSADLKRRRLK